MNYKNNEGYPDPTSCQAIHNVEQKATKDLNLMNLLRSVARIAGFEIIGTVTLRHIKSGVSYKHGQKKKG